MPNTIDIIEKATAISLEVTQWGGRTKLTAKDLRGDVQLPPGTLASLGSKKIYDPKELHIFNTLKARAEKVLKDNGIARVIARGCWIVPTHKAALVIAELRSIKAEFDAALADFLTDYDRKLEEWLVENDEWREIIEKALMTKDEVRSRIAFNWHAFSFGATSDPELNDQLVDKLSGLTGRLFVEIAQIAKDSWEKSFEGKDEVMHTALGRLKVLRDKLEGFAGCSGLVLPIVQDIDRVLAAVPDNGQPISGLQLMAIQGLMTLLKDPGEAMAYAQRKLEGKAGEDPFIAWASGNGFQVGDSIPAAVAPEQIQDAQPAKPNAAPGDASKELPLLSITIKRGEAPVFEDEPEDEPEAAEQVAPEVSAPAPAESIAEEAPQAAALGPVEVEPEAPAAVEAEAASEPESKPEPLAQADEDGEEESEGEPEEDEELEDMGVPEVSFGDDFCSTPVEFGFQGEYDPDDDTRFSAIDVVASMGSYMDSSLTGLDCSWED